MGRKAKKPPPLPDLTPELNDALCRIQALQRGGFCRVQLRKGRERMAKEIISAAFDSAWADIRSKVVDEKLPQYAAQTMLLQMNRVIAWSTLAPEASPLLVAASSSPQQHHPPSEMWAVEAQPTSTGVDRHASRLVTAPPKPPPPKVLPRSNSSRERHSSRRTHRASTPQSSRGTRSGGSSRAGASDKTPADVIEIRDLSDPATKKGGVGSGGGAADLLSMMTPTEREYHMEMERKAADKARLAALEAARVEEEKRKQEEWDEAMREVAGKSWTVDSEGTIIVVSAPDGDKDLDKYPLSIKSTIKTEESSSSAAAAASPGKKSPKSGPEEGEEDEKKRKGKQQHGVHFTSSTEEQPNMAKNRRFLPEDGVELQASPGGGRGPAEVKGGRDFQSPENQLSRRAYYKKMGFELPDAEERTHGGSDDDGGGGGGDGDDDAAPGRGRGRRSKAARSKGFPDIDPFQGGRKRAVQQAAAAAVTVAAGATAAVVTLPPATAAAAQGNNTTEGGEEATTQALLVSEEEAMAKELELIAELNRAGGNNGRAPEATVLPQKGYERPRSLTHKHKDMRGVINHDHFPVGAVPTAHREKLAAPTKLGASTGHGDQSLVGSPTTQSQPPLSPGGESWASEGLEDGRSGRSDASATAAAGGDFRKTASRVTIPQNVREQGLQYQIALGSPSSSTRPSRG